MIRKTDREYCACVHLQFCFVFFAQVDRRFHDDATVADVQGFLALYLEDNDIPITNFSMSTNFPRRTYTEADQHLSVVEAGLHPQVVLFVHDLDA